MRPWAGRAVALNVKPKVKPMRITTPRIVQPGEGGVRPWVWLLFLVALGAWSWQVFHFGQQRAGFDINQANAREDRLRERLTEIEQERDVLRAAAARFERAGQIDRAAADGVKAEIKTLQDERAELKREVAFLKTLVSSGGDNKQLLLDNYRLTAVGDEAYRFEVTLSKAANDSATVNGQVILRVKGKSEGTPKTLDMKALTDGRRTNIGVRFKNFQKLKADLQLPIGFEPTAIEVGVKLDGNRFKSFEQAYDWRLSDA